MSVIIHLQNLPWNATVVDIRQFFHGLFIPEGGVLIVGGERGNAFINFRSEEDARLAMAFNRAKIHDSQIELFPSSKMKMQNSIAAIRRAPPMPAEPSTDPFSCASPPARSNGFEHSGVLQHESTRQPVRPNSGMPRATPFQLDVGANDDGDDDFNQLYVRQNSEDFHLGFDRSREFGRSIDAGISSLRRGLDTTHGARMNLRESSLPDRPLAEKLLSNLQRSEAVKYERFEGQNVNRRDGRDYGVRVVRDMNGSKTMNEPREGFSRHEHRNMNREQREFGDPCGFRLRHNLSAEVDKNLVVLTEPKNRDVKLNSTFNEPENFYRNRDLFSVRDVDDRNPNRSHDSISVTGMDERNFHWNRDSFSVREMDDRRRCSIDEDMRQRGREDFLRQDSWRIKSEKPRGSERKVVRSRSRSGHVRLRYSEEPEDRVTSMQSMQPTQLKQQGSQEAEGSDFCVRIENIPNRNHNYRKIRSFFTRLNCEIPQGDGMKLVNDQHGTFTGIGYLKFDDHRSFSSALSCSGIEMASNVITVVPCSLSEYNDVIDGFNPKREGHRKCSPIRTPADWCVIIKNLSPLAERKDIEKYLGYIPIPEAGGPFMEIGADDARTGNALVQFAREKDYRDALSLDGIVSIGTISKREFDDRTDRARRLVKPEGSNHGAGAVVENTILTTEFRCAKSRKVEANPGGFKTGAGLALERAKQTAEFHSAKSRRVEAKRDAEEFVLPRTSQKHQSVYVKLQGLSYETTDADVREFFSGLAIAEHGIRTLRTMDGKASEWCFVQFENAQEARRALKRDGEYINRRCIVVKLTTQEFMMDRISAHEKTLLNPVLCRFHERRDTTEVDYSEHPYMEQSEELAAKNTCVKLRGLPWSTTEEVLREFFDNVKLPKDGIHILYNPDGRPNGSAFIQFYCAADALKALRKHLQCIGRRYIEIQICRASHMVASMKQHEIMHSEGESMSDLASPRRREEEGENFGGGEFLTLKMENLSVDVMLEDIVDFFFLYHPISESVKLQYRDRDERPTGEGLVSFRSPGDAARALARQNGRLMLSREIRLSPWIDHYS